MRFRYNKNIIISALQKHCCIENAVLESESDVVQVLSILLKAIDAKCIVIGTNFFGYYDGECAIDGQDVILELSKEEKTWGHILNCELQKYISINERLIHKSRCDPQFVF